MTPEEIADCYLRSTTVQTSYLPVEVRKLLAQAIRDTLEEAAKEMDKWADAAKGVGTYRTAAAAIRALKDES